MRLLPDARLHKKILMKNSTRRNIRRRTTPLRITLLVALAVSGVIGLFRNSITEAARDRENTLVSGSSAPTSRHVRESQKLSANSL
jgi:hypothetical protein